MKLYPYRLDAQGNAHCRICDSQCTVATDPVNKIVTRECRNAPHVPVNVYVRVHFGGAISRARAIVFSRGWWNERQRKLKEPCELCNGTGFAAAERAGLAPLDVDELMKTIHWFQNDAEGRGQELDAAELARAIAGKFGAAGRSEVAVCEAFVERLKKRLGYRAGSMMNVAAVIVDMNSELTALREKEAGR